MWETWIRSLGWEDPLEKGKATHSSILAWRIPWTVSWGLKESDMTEQLSLFSFFLSFFFLNSKNSSFTGTRAGEDITAGITPVEETSYTSIHFYRTR